jgi:hypothetical protein
MPPNPFSKLSSEGVGIMSLESSLLLFKEPQEIRKKASKTIMGIILFIYPHKR